jgi:holo-[acyl-carrier protein] synthase
MPTAAIGIDIIEIARVGQALSRHGQRFLDRVYTPIEIAFCRGRVPELAARFAAKEAVMKALGTGVRGIAWREVEVLPNRRGKPLIYLHGKAADRARAIGLKGIDVSLTHSQEFAIAAVVGTQHAEIDDPDEARAQLILRLVERGLL